MPGQTWPTLRPLIPTKTFRHRFCFRFKELSQCKHTLPKALTLSGNWKAKALCFLCLVSKSGHQMDHARIFFQHVYICFPAYQNNTFYLKLANTFFDFQTSELSFGNIKLLIGLLCWVNKCLFNLISFKHRI